MAYGAGIITSGRLLPASEIQWAPTLFAHNPKPPINLETYTLSAESGSFSFTGMVADLLASLVLAAATVAFSWTGTAASTLYNRLLDAQSASYAETGTAANLLKESALPADPGSFAFSGTASRPARFADIQC